MISIFKPKSGTLVHFFLFRDKFKKLWSVQRQSFAYVLQNNCSYICVGKYLVLVSLFNKVAGRWKICKNTSFYRKPPVAAYSISYSTYQNS